MLKKVDDFRRSCAEDMKRQIEVQKTYINSSHPDFERYQKLIIGKKRVDQAPPVSWNPYIVGSWSLVQLGGNTFKLLLIEHICQIHANLVILATPLRVLGHQVVSLGHLGGFVAF